MKNTASKLFAAFLVAAIAPAYAQDSSPVLRVDRGTAMTSSGSEFVTANSGTAVSSGQRIMVPENSAVTVIYSNGCTRTYTAPGVYVVEPDCVGAAVARNGATDLQAAGIIVGTVAVTAAVLANMDKGVTPVSR